MNIVSIDFAGTIFAALLTMMVLSYLIGDNPLFRIATHIFVGVSAGYAGVIAWYNVINPGFFQPLLDLIGAGADFSSLDWIIRIILVLIPWVLGALMLFKLSSGTSRLGTVPVALMVGVGAAVVIGGAITGTIIPQTRSAITTLFPAGDATATVTTRAEQLLEPIIMIGGTLTTLLYFNFTVSRGKSGTANQAGLLRIASLIGRVFISITFGAMYAGALMAAIVVLSDRMQFLVGVIAQLLTG